MECLMFKDKIVPESERDTTLEISHLLTIVFLNVC